MAGVSLAWLLDGLYDVVLLEAQSSLGGNVQSVGVEVGGNTYTVDAGAQFFHPGPYPTYVALLQELGLYPPDTGESHAFPASITLRAPGEATPRFVSPVLPDRAWPLVAPWNAAGIRAFSKLFQAAKRREQLNAPYALTLGAWLPTLGLTQAQWEGMLLPWAASLFSGDIEQTRSLSARAAMIFAAKALPPNPLDPVLYYVLEAGMVAVLDSLVSQLTTTTQYVGAAVSSVQRTPQGGFRIQAGAGLELDVDQIVFASSGPPTLALLAGLSGTASQSAALSGIEFTPATLMLHTDPIYAAPTPGARSFLNCEVHGGFCEASMSIDAVLAPTTPAPLPGIWKSWVTHRDTLPANVLYEASFKHMLPTPASLDAQDALRALQGAGGIWFAGGYTYSYDSQETALLSAMEVADGLGA